MTASSETAVSIIQIGGEESDKYLTSPLALGGEESDKYTLGPGELAAFNAIALSCGELALSRSGSNRSRP